MARSPRIRFIVASFDGPRPDLIDPSLRPSFFRLRRADVALARHRTVYSNETRVAFPSWVTGARPDRQGMIGNNYIDCSTTPPRYTDRADAAFLGSLGLEMPASIAGYVLPEKLQA